MTKGLISTLSFGLLLFLSQLSLAQVDQNQIYLQKTGILDSLYSEILNESRKIYIQLPFGFDPSKNQKYPVAYILDGEVFLPTVNEIQNYYSGGFTPEMALVGIVSGPNRVRDLTPSKINSKYGMPFNQENGEADTFRRFLQKELIPFIESKYPVTSYRSLIGHSYGGLFTIATLIEQPDLFANYLAIDPSLDWDNQKLLKSAKEQLGNHNYQNKALFLSLSGQLHMQNSEITINNVMQDSTDFTLFARSNINFRNLLQDNAADGLAFDWKFYPNDIHGTVPLPSIMDGMISIFEWYQMENTDRINSFDTPKEELLSIIKYREKKLQEHFGYTVPPYPEELLNMSGYMNMDMQALEKTKMYFELAMEYYPQSANAYDSMADYYEASGDFSQALEYVQKAAALSDDQYYKDRIQDLKNK